MSQQSIHCVLNRFQFGAIWQPDSQIWLLRCGKHGYKKNVNKRQRRGLKRSPATKCQAEHKAASLSVITRLRGNSHILNKQAHVCQQLRTGIMFFTGKQMVTSPHHLLPFIMGYFPVVSFENRPRQTFYFSHNSSHITFIRASTFVIDRTSCFIIHDGHIGLKIIYIAAPDVDGSVALYDSVYFH